jgi:tetratricopeptide (TPR) repeat protein
MPPLAGRVVVGALVFGLLAAGALASPTAQAQGWGARKDEPVKPTTSKPRSKKPRSKKPRTRKPRGTSPRRSGRSARKRLAADAPLADQVAALGDRGGRRWADDAVRLLRACTARREMVLAGKVAAALAEAPRVPATACIDAAMALGEDTTLALPLWRRAWADRRLPPALRLVVAEGFVDALLAGGALPEARRVLDRALRLGSVGSRGGLFERLVTWGRLAAEIAEVRDLLERYRDPDAAVQASLIAAETGDDDEALAILEAAWRRFPGHRALQTRLIKGLKRRGDRKKLTTVVERIVRLVPSDPMPWLDVIEAHVVARDARTARQLTDKLVRRHRRNDAFVESLIDLEQQLGAEPARLDMLYGALLDAAPRNPAHVEAYADWLLGRARDADAMRVLARLDRMPAGRWEANRRKAMLLQTHGKFDLARKLLTEMLQIAPERREAERLLAMLDTAEGATGKAQQRWRRLAELSGDEDEERRRLAGEARRALVSGWLTEGTLPKMRSQLRREVDRLRDKAPLGLVLLWLEVHLRRDVLDTAAPPEVVRSGAHPAVRRWQADAEVLTGLGTLQRRALDWARALSTVRALEQVDAVSAQELRVAIVETALARGDDAVAREAEGPLLADKQARASLLLRLGDLHLRVGDVEGAAALFRRAAARSVRDTRPIERLALLFRQTGDARGEIGALRSIVERTVDPEVLEGAGQRLLVLSMASGSSAELVRWLDAISLRHPRRDFVQRLRLSAYDTWLTMAPLEALLGTDEGAAPPPSLIGDALSSGDLAMQLRALKQARRRKRMISESVARRLLRDRRSVVRREAVLSLAASGDVRAARLIAEMDTDPRPDVVRAQVVAFGTLPPVAGVVPWLTERTTERRRLHAAALAALALGQTGDPAALSVLRRVIDGGKSTVRPAAVMGLGLLLAKLDAGPQRDAGLAILLDGVGGSGALSRRAVPLEPYAWLWALAASGHDDALDRLVRVAVYADGAVARRAALRLAYQLSQGKAPTLDVAVWRVAAESIEDRALVNVVLRAALIDSVAHDDATDRRALAALQSTLLPHVTSAARDGLWTDDAERGWCRGFGDALEAAPALADRCTR